MSPNGFEGNLFDSKFARLLVELKEVNILNDSNISLLKDQLSKNAIEYVYQIVVLVLSDKKNFDSVTFDVILAHPVLFSDSKLSRQLVSIWVSYI